MEVLEELKHTIEKLGVRVPERLGLLALMSEEDGVSRLRGRLREAQGQLDEAASKLHKEAMGR